MTILDCELRTLPKVSDPRGNLTFIEGGNHIPFDIRRVFYLYGVPQGAGRGGHAHKTLHQFIIAVTGSFDVLLDDGREKRHVHLSRADRGLHVLPMVWATLGNFSSGAVCVVLASDRYDEADYYRNYGDFLAARGLR